MQTMSVQLGGSARPASKDEYGFASVNVECSVCKLLGQLAKDNNKSLEVWMSHGIEVSKVTGGFDIVTSNSNFAIAAIENSEKISLVYSFILR